MADWLLLLVGVMNVTAGSPVPARPCLCGAATEEQPALSLGTFPGGYSPHWTLGSGTRVGRQLLKAEQNECEEEMVASFGNLACVDTGLNGAAGPCGKVDCSKTPQLIEIHLKCLRGVKDKVPKGHYTLKVSVLSRLGGGLLEWPKLKEQPQARTTLPVSHGGNFYNTEIYFGQSIQTILPPRKAVKPGMVLLFELFLLRGTCTWIDREVGWGAFPLCDNNFNPLEGKYKCPFLRGHYDSKVDRFKKIENFISQDLDHWLCNLYFQIIKLPQDSDKQNKHDMQLHLPPELLMYSGFAEKNGVLENVEQSGPQGQPLTSPKDPDTHKGSIPTVVKEVEKQFNAVKGGEACVSEEAERKREELKMLPAGKTHVSENYVAQPLGLILNSDTTRMIRGRFTTGQGPDGTKRMIFTKIAMAMQMSTAACFSKRKTKKDITSCRPAAEVKPFRRVVERFHFVVYAAFSELGPARWRSRDFWLLVLLVVLLWFVRLYLHYLSQWLFLQTISVPVTKFQLFPHTVELCYQNSLLLTSEELVMVVVGPLTLNAGLLLMVLIRWGCQQLFDSFPSFLSKFIMALGLWTVLDPLAVFIVDSVLGRLGNSVEKPIADAAKLYWVFLRAEESGIPGALITVMLYTILFIISSTVLYLYFLRLHSEGWLLDVFQRIHGEEGTFFVPLDLEISNQELSYIMKRAEQWRGVNGERRMTLPSGKFMLSGDFEEGSMSDAPPNHSASILSTCAYSGPSHINVILKCDDRSGGFVDSNYPADMYALRVGGKAEAPDAVTGPIWVAVSDYIWKDHASKPGVSSCDLQRQDESLDSAATWRGSTTVRISVYTVHLSGFQELYRRFLRLPDGAIVEETVLKESKHNSLPWELVIHQSEDNRVLELAKENKRRHVAYMK
ncbi:hypothetical protein llap_3985 [Limosa lapponica baueri]|uniref:Orofacial cleft 1 candidate gene 1 protein n=1 Tax=Limosa lapponica baueri TaxID=1758121 RepID=A0A2I0UI53_LIMLA|nr:hypothetical protein llap_3985 [Limosa lapponica baueri]